MTTESGTPNTPAYMQAPTCLICGGRLTTRLARGRKSGKPFVMFRCGTDGRHFIAFINHQPYSPMSGRS